MEAPPYERVPQPDILPSYQPSVDRKGRLLCKQELETPDTPALQRHWHRVEAELRGTTFLLFEVSSRDSSTGTRTKCFRSPTLQAADVGLATDYSQWPNVFRARLEGEQLLFIAPGVVAAMAWLDSLGAAIAISEPLEARKMPGYPRMPARATKPWALGSASGDGFGSRLWTELAWRARQRHEWLFETPSRPRNERWREVVHGRESNHRSRPRSTRLWKSTRSAAAEPGSNGRSVSSTSQCQCPCSSCWKRDAQPLIAAPLPLSPNMILPRSTASTLTNDLEGRWAWWTTHIGVRAFLVFERMQRFYTTFIILAVEGQIHAITACLSMQELICHHHFPFS